MRSSDEAFEVLVDQALEGLPNEILPWLDNVAVVVAERPTRAHLAQAGLRSGDLLFGQYGHYARAGRWYPGHGAAP